VIEGLTVTKLEALTTICREAGMMPTGEATALTTIVGLGCLGLGYMAGVSP
jgi:hypothetical protein